MKKLLALLIAVLLNLPVYAHDIEVTNEDGVTIYYNYINDEQELLVTYKTDGDNSYSGSVVIPDEVSYMNKTRKVTKIGERAFYNCTDLTSVTIPNSVTWIDNKAFDNCISLKSVNISDLAAWCNINFVNVTTSNPLYYAHHLFLNGEEIFNLVIPNNVTIIKGSAFYGCSSLTSVSIPNGVTDIGSSAFRECSSLTSITFPNSMKRIGNDVFRKCSSLTFITFPNSVTNIGTRAFDRCDNSVVISKIENPFNIKTNVFSNYNATLYVPKGTVDKYKATEGWNNFASIEEINNEIEDKVTEVMAMPVLIQANEGVLNITGAPEGAAISVYDTSGRQLGNSTAKNSSAKITIPNTSKIAIIKIGDKSVKVSLK